MDISIVIPAYNEQATIKGLADRIFEALDRDIELVIVDDGSEDLTGSLAEEAGARVVRNPYRMGNGAAVKRGIRAASNAVVVLMDADGQHPPEEIPALLDKLNSHEMAIGARFNSRQDWFRKLANTVFNRLASYVSGVKVYDLTSGFRAFKRDKALKFLYLLPNTFSYPSTLTLSFIKAAYPVAFVPVKVLARQGGKSKINLLSDGARFLVIIMRIAVFFSPLKVFLPVSLGFFSLGLGYYLFTFFAYHRLTNMSVLLFTTSVIIFMLGLISEQVSSLRMERTDR